MILVLGLKLIKINICHRYIIYSKNVRDSTSTRDEVDVNLIL